ncbi:MAG: hypothetical protein ACLTGI_01595 [Hoylesella buccalis]
MSAEIIRCRQRYYFQRTIAGAEGDSGGWRAIICEITMAFSPPSADAAIVHRSRFNYVTAEEKMVTATFRNHHSSDVIGRRIQTSASIACKFALRWIGLLIIRR